MRLVLCGISIVVLAVVGSSDGLAQSQPPSTATQLSHAEFVKLDFAARRQRFAEVNAETKAAIMRSHITDWLTRNRSRLSAGQVEVVRDVTAFVTPRLYENGQTRSSRPVARRSWRGFSASCAIQTS